MGVAHGQIQTVTGPIDPADLGLTLPHEHIYARLWDNQIVATAGWGLQFGAMRMEDDDLASEIGRFLDRGGRSIVELALPAIGRDPTKLREMSLRTGANIVMGCGWYREPFYPAEDLIDRRSSTTWPPPL